MFEIIILSLLQGVTEFLPVSSSAHLILFSKFFNFNNQNLTIDVSLHFGSLLAVIYFFKNEIINFFKNKNLFLLVVISSLPTLIFGYIIIELNIINSLRNIAVIGWATIIFGLALYFADYRKQDQKVIQNFKLSSALFIGFFQIFSLIPGVSRSGIVITAARILKFERTEAAKISFLLSIPTLAAASFYNFQKIIFSNNYNFLIENYTYVILSFIFSLMTIKFFLKYLKKFSLFFFVIYRIFLGIIILFYVYI